MARRKKEWTALSETLLDQITLAMRRGLITEDICGLFDINPKDFQAWMIKGLEDENSRPTRWKTLEARLVKASRRTRAQMYDEWIGTVAEGQGQRSKNAIRLLETYFPNRWKKDANEPMVILAFVDPDEDEPLKTDATLFDLEQEALSHVQK